MSQQFSVNGVPFNVYQNGQFVHPMTGAVAGMDTSIFSVTPSMMVNAGMMGNIAGMGVDMNSNLMMPQWMQNLYSGLANYQMNAAIAQYPVFQASGDQSAANPFGTVDNSGVGQNPLANPGSATPAPAVQTAEQIEVQQELNQRGISTTGDLDADKAKLEEEQAKEARNKADAADIAKQLYKAMKGWGTDEEAVYSALDRLNDDNVLLVMEEWDNNYKSSMGGDSLMEAIQNDFSGNEEKKAIDKLNKALTHKARSQRQESEAGAYEGKVEYENECSGFWRWAWADDDVINDSFTTLVQQLAQGDATARQKSAQDAARHNTY